ncbi:hypothetical protein [Prochlorococcus marinus]|uniref:hypothetical protein n=1 Tax=Prochlorococcus marinus TaxID=1219 RepID=UPI0022B47243|nr:hypothetical protein [Prochlorococcus marinus]
MSEKYSHQSFQNGKKSTGHSNIVPINHHRNLLELLHPGSFVRLDNQPKDLPPFQVIVCKGGRCLVRQQSWGRYIHWEVAHNRLKSA